MNTYPESHIKKEAILIYKEIITTNDTNRKLDLHKELRSCLQLINHSADFLRSIMASYTIYGIGLDTSFETTCILCLYNTNNPLI